MCFDITSCAGAFALSQVAASRHHVADSSQLMRLQGVFLLAGLRQGRTLVPELWIRTAHLFLSLTCALRPDVGIQFCFLPDPSLFRRKDDHKF
jgi:hypothetical protein